MFPTSSTTQIITPFGSGYVPMQHGEPTRWNLAQADWMTWSSLSELRCLAKC